MSTTQEREEIAMPSRMFGLFVLTAFVLGIPVADAQPAPLTSTPVTCQPISRRTGELGCWILVDQRVGPLTESQVFWHMDVYPTQEAANAAIGPHGTVVSSLGKTWLLTLEASTWQAPAGGQHVATTGPLPIPPADSYVATYMEAILAPGMQSAIHDHPGPEVFYTMTGETCLETPEGKSVGRVASSPVIVPGGVPMQLTVTGEEKRRGLILILHDASMPSAHLVHDWTPKGLCR
jgi:quercetin dioxygenase-like cupin family protein